MPSIGRRVPRLRAAGLVAALPAFFACGDANPRPPAVAPATAREPATAPLFTEVTSEVGLPPPPAAWPDGTFFSPEIMGPGVALFDYDGDLDLDILQVRMPPPGQRDAPAPDRLFRHERDGSFVEVSGASGLADPGFGMGVAVGDVENDGDLDVYVGNYGPDRFYRNDGDGTFTEATEAAGFRADDRWTSAATFCDVDGDGFLDLYVVHYLLYKHRGACLGAAGQEDYCGPPSFNGVPDRLYRNRGDGTFRDVTEEAGLVPRDAGRTAKGLGVICADLTGDDLPDIWVANDGEANHLWVNRGGTFDEQGIPRGVALSRDGAPEAGMGVAAGDLNGDLALDLYVTHLHQENNRLYLSGAGGLFQDRTQEAGLAQHDLVLTGFGCGFFDYDNDADLDIAVVNGRVYRGPILPGASKSPFWNNYAEPNLLFENRGDGSFENASGRSGRFGSEIDVSRALAFGDLDADGDLDMVVTTVDDGLRVFRNDAPPPGRHWLFVKAMIGRRDGVGARVTLVTGGERRLGIVLPGYSYQSSSDPRVHFGLGERDRFDGIEVVWPDRAREAFPGGAADREVVVQKGEGRRL